MKMKNILFLSAFTLGMLTAVTGFAQAKDNYTLEQRQAMQKGAAAANKTYGALRKEMMDLLKKNDLAGAEAAAEKMVAVAQESEKKYANYHRLYLPRTYADIAGAFAGKKLFGAKYTVKWYEKALAANKDPDIFINQKYGIFLKMYYLADEAKIKQLITGGLDGGPYSVSVLANYVGPCLDYYTHEQIYDYMMKHAARVKDPAGLEGEQKRAIQWYVGRTINSKKYAEAIAFCDKLMADKKYSADMKTFIALRKADALCYIDLWKGIAEFERLLKIVSDKEKIELRATMIQHLEKNAYRFYLPNDPVHLKKIIEIAREGMKDHVAVGFSGKRTIYARINAGLKLGDTADLKAVFAKLRTLPDLETKHHDIMKAILFAEGKMAYDAENYAEALASLEKMNALFNGKYHHLQVGSVQQMLDMIIRSCCAIGDYKKALSYKDAFMKNSRRPTQNRYKVYFEYLEKRAAEQK